MNTLWAEASERAERVSARSDARYVERARKLRQMLNLVPAGSSGTIHQLFGMLSAKALRGMKGYELDCIAGLRGSACTMGREINRGRALARFVVVKAKYHRCVLGGKNSANAQQG